MGISYTLNTNTLRLRQTLLVILAVIILSALGVIFSSPTTQAADAAWNSSSDASITFNGTTYSGPHTNKMDALSWTGWSPGGDTEKEAIFYRADNETIIWFSKGVSVKTANKANYSKLKNNIGFDAPSYYTLESTREITLSADQTTASLGAVKGVYRSSISDYINSECSKAPFNTSASQRECRDNVSNRFDTCWNGQTSDNSFTFNSSKPGESINVAALADCIVAGTEVGRAVNYQKNFEDARNEANTKGVEAYKGAAPEGTDTGDTESSCKIDGIGWIICPVMNFTANIVDGAYVLVADLLAVQPLATSGASATTYQAWTMMRNIANVAFVIAFIIVIFSQLTSLGLNNYGIKKMLPRLVVAAILVNVSYWICAIAVDISNILGASLKSLFEGMSGTFGKPNTGAFATGEGWVGITGGVLAGVIGGGILLYTTFSALLPALVVALIAIVTVFLVLTLRQALIILLIVISPLAFVAFLLPNTESLFKKWKGLLQTLLLMYPIIAVIFGASAFASAIVMQGAGDNIAVQIMGALIAIIPLAITPVIMKTAGGLLNRFGGIVNNPNKGPLDRIRKNAEGYRDYRKDIARGNRISRGSELLKGEGGKFGKRDSYRRKMGALLVSGGATRAIDRDQQNKFAKAVSDESAQEYFAERALRDSKFALSIAGTDGKAEGLKASAQSAVDKIIRQDSENREILYTADIKIRNNPGAELDKLLKENPTDIVGINALGSMIMKGGSSAYGEFTNILDDYEKSGGSEEALDVARKFISDNGAKFKEKDPAVLKWAKSVPGYETIGQAQQQPNSVSGSDEEVAKVAPDSLRRAAAAGIISVDRANAILNNEDLASRTPEDNLLTLKAVRDSNAAQMNIPTGLSSKDSMREIKNEINRINENSTASPTVIIPETTSQASQQTNADQAPNPTVSTPQPTTQSNPTTLTIPHDNISTPMPVNVNVTTNPTVVAPNVSTPSSPATGRSTTSTPQSDYVNRDPQDPTNPANIPRDFFS